MILQYEILAAKSGQSVVEKVNALLKANQGWQPQGGLVWNPLTQQYAQAIVRTATTGGHNA